MARLEHTVAEAHWLAVIERTRRDPTTRWRVEGDDGYFVEGKLEAWPPGPPRGWDLRQAIEVADRRLWIGHVRRIEPVL